MSQPNLNTIKKQFAKLAPEYGIRKAALFGSFARAEAKKKSDIDILIDLPQGKTLLDLAAIKNDLRQNFKFPVDVVTYNSLHPLLKKQILKEQQIIYERS